MKIILLIILLFIGSTLRSQYFEGSIEFTFFKREILPGVAEKKTPIPKMPISKIIIKGNNLKLMTDALNENRYILVQDSGEYTVDHIAEKVYKRTSSRNNDSLVPTKEYLNIYAKKLRKKESILGYKCTVYSCNRINRGRKEFVKYWVTDEIQANYTNTAMIEGLGVRLKTISRINNTETILEATKISIESTDKIVFEIPLYTIEEIKIDHLIKKHIQD